jgi:hypothetical protein
LHPLLSVMYGAGLTSVLYIAWHITTNLQPITYTLLTWLRVAAADGGITWE